MIANQLSPDDIEMANIYKRYLASMSARSGPSNALSNSTLLDDEIPSSATVKDGEAGGPPPKLPPEQRILLLQALLSIGELPAALLLLGRFPWIALTHPAVADSILRIVAYALEDVYSAISDVPDTGSEEDDLDMEELAPTALRVAGKEIIPSILVPCPPGTSSRSHAFFFPAWREGLERWSTADELLEKAPRWLSPVRGLGGRSVDLMSKICRIGAAHFIALRRSKEEELGLQHGARSKDELRMVEVRQPLACAQSELTTAIAEFCGNATVARPDSDIPLTCTVRIWRDRRLRHRVVVAVEPLALSRPVRPLRRMARWHL